MKSDKELKNEFRPKFWSEPEKYYPVSFLKDEGFKRKICIKCKKPFWSIDEERKVCGEPSCSGEGFAFIHNSPAKRKLEYIEVWNVFSRMFESFGYTPIKRYPVIARWNPTIYYVNASIADFQPYVISGEVEPPANPLVIPQFCLRFNDIDNVGITQAHNTGFVMIGQHMFAKPDKWSQTKVFGDIYTWLTKGLLLKKDDIIFHEDAWAGGGNFGPCMEFFSKGCELGNQVYMLYEQTPYGFKPLDIKVLDMGMGQERNAWFSQGCETIYDASFPNVIKKLLDITGLKINKEVMRKYVPHAGLLNLDESENVEKAWIKIAKLIGMDAKELKNFILPLSGVYSIAEHMRTFLVASADGGLPSNVGGGYNLRILARRAMMFKNRYEWNIDFADVCEWHAKYLKPLFPELLENLEEVNKIIKVEEKKYEETKKKSIRIVAKLMKKDVSEADLIKLYDTHGIPPEIIKMEFEKIGKKLEVPEDFYAKVSQLHEIVKEKSENEIEEKIEIENVPETKPLYLDDYKLLSFRAKVLKVKDRYVVLDQTAFYPTSGGQMHDIGTLNNKKVENVFKHGGVIVHVLEKNHNLKEGIEVEGKIDWERRLKLSQHHTATHILNAAARMVLGNHINQAGAKKTEKKAHLDVTHYQPIYPEEALRIERIANEIIERGIKVEKLLMPRNEAEKKFGMRIYQGGAVPGKMIRIVNIEGVDAEACGGTHLNNTKEVGRIKIIKTTKIQDGVVRIEFTAGEEAEKSKESEKLLFENVLKNLNKILDFKSKDEMEKQLKECALFFNVPTEHVGKTVEKFTKEIEHYAEKLGVKIERKKVKNMKEACKIVFDLWKDLKKSMEKMDKGLMESEAEVLIKEVKNGEITKVVDMERGEMIMLCDAVVRKKPDITIILINKNGDVVGMSEKKDIVKMVKDLCQKYGGSGGGKGRLAQGKLDYEKFIKSGVCLK
jgi:alanyl-tRNA synthetase